MSDAVSENVNALPEQINEMAIRIQKMVGKQPGNFNDLVSEYYAILVDIGAPLGVPATVGSGNTTELLKLIQELTDQIVTNLKDGAVKKKVSDDNLQKLYDFFVKYEGAIKSVESGLLNEGKNTCFMNATLQMFYHIPEVKDAVLKLNPVEDNQTEIRSAFDMLSGDKSQGEVTCSLERGRQHDAHEYIMNDFVPAVLDLQNLKPIFNTEFVTQSSDEETVTDQPIISVPIISDKSVEQMIISSLTEESDKTVQTPVDSRYTRIPKLNKYLLIHLKRSEVKLNDEGKSYIETDGTVLPPTKIDTTFGITPNSQLVLPENKGAYKLIGFIEHIGSNLMSGHYVYHWLNESGVWYTFDDSEAKPWKESRQNSAKTDFPLFGHGYIYLYERVGNNGSPLNAEEETNNYTKTPTKPDSIPSKLDQTSDAITNIKVLVRRQYNTERKYDILPYKAFVTLDDPGDSKIYGGSWLKFNDEKKNYKPFWYSQNDSLKNVDNTLSVWSDGQEDMKSYEVVDFEFIVNKDSTKGGRRRTRKNKRRITKRKVNKNKNKTKGKNRKH